MPMLRNDSELSRSFMDIKDQFDRKSETITINSSVVQDAASMLLEHSYLDICNNTAQWNLKCGEESLINKMCWFRLDVLPVQVEKDKMGLLGRWQSVLTSAHKPGMKLAVALVRKKGETSIYIGACRDGEKNISAEQLSQSISKFMDGAKLQRMGMNNSWAYPVDINQFEFGGITTGIPSLKGEESGKYLQTLDTLASGITLDNMPKDYAIIIRADAVSNYEVERLITSLLDMKTALVPLSSWSASINSGGRSESRQRDSKTTKVAKGVAIGASLVKLAAFVASFTPAASAAKAISGIADIAGGTATTMLFAGKGDGSTESINYPTSSTSVNYTDERNKYIIGMIDAHIKRLEEGRSLGFWNTGVYVLADDTDTVDTALGMIKAVYSGQKTYLDPIRSYSERARDGLICRYAKNMQLLPMPTDVQSPFGPLYQYISTPVTTAELSIECNLPRKDYTGLKNSVDAVRFSYNPPRLPPDKRRICLGEVYNEGVPTGIKYEIDVDALARHGVMPGEAGSGKSTTIRTAIHGLEKLGIPFLVIDPVKDGFIDMAVEYNERIKNDPDYEKKRIRIYKPGSRAYRYLDMEKKAFRNVELDRISINLYQPGTYGKTDVNLSGHINTISSLLANSMGMVNSLPQLLKEAMRKYMEKFYGEYIHETIVPSDVFWKHTLNVLELEAVALQLIEKEKTYEQDIKGNLEQCIINGLEEIQTGWKRDLISAYETRNLDEVFDHPAVISLADLGSDDEKSFAITILMQWLRDYRISRYNNDMDYHIALRKREQLMHLVIIDEAHAVLGKPKPVTSSEEINPGQETAKVMGKILSEMREYGQGVLAADQFASRLIEDVRKNSNVVIIHQMKAKDECELMGNAINLTEEQQKYISSLQQGHMIIRYGSHEACWVKVDKHD